MPYPTSCKYCTNFLCEPPLIHKTELLLRNHFVPTSPRCPLPLYAPAEDEPEVDGRAPSPLRGISANLSRHPGENRGPETLSCPGYRLPPV